MQEEILKDITVIDLTQMLQGPYTTQKLGEMGAEIIKIEPPGGENGRKTKMAGLEINGENPSFHAINQNKKSVEVDLSSPRGRKICLDLATTADVLVHNFRPGVAEKLALTYEDVRAENNRIIYCTTSGYGQSGPYVGQELPGQDLLVQSLGGLASVNGRAEDPPTPSGVAVADIYSGLLAAYAVVLALFHRERTGTGQKIDTTLFDAVLELQVQELNIVLNFDEQLERSEAGIASPVAPAPYGIYETSNGYLAVAAFGWGGSVLEDLFELFDIQKHRDLQHPFRDRDQIKESIEEKTKECKTETLIDLLRDKEIWCAPVKSINDVPDDPQLQHREKFISYQHPEEGELITTAPPYEFSHAKPSKVTSAPEAGGATEEILHRLDYTDAQLESLRSEDII